MSWLNGLDSHPGSETASYNSDAALVLIHVSSVLLDLANPAEDAIEANLGLSESARIALDITKIAQRAKSHRKACVDIADQTYQLLNAVDGGVKGRAIDVNGVLREHITRLNADLAHIRALLECFAAWWSIARLWKAPQRLQRCYDILGHGMEMYLRLLRCSLVQPSPPSRRAANRKKWKTVPSSALGRRPAPAKEKRRPRSRDEGVPTKAGPRVAKSVSQPPHGNRTFAADAS